MLESASGLTICAILNNNLGRNKWSQAICVSILVDGLYPVPIADYLKPRFGYGLSATALAPTPPAQFARAELGAFRGDRRPLAPRAGGWWPGHTHPDLICERPRASWWHLPFPTPAQLGSAAPGAAAFPSQIRPHCCRWSRHRRPRVDHQTSKPRPHQARETRRLRNMLPQRS
jgi:hypothetical protein